MKTITKYWINYNTGDITSTFYSTTMLFPWKEIDKREYDKHYTSALKRRKKEKRK